MPVNLIVSLADKESLLLLRNQGLNSYLYGMSRDAVNRAINTYLQRGASAFLSEVPSVQRDHDKTKYVKALPERIRDFELYPSIIKDVRLAPFKYHNSWEATVVLRVFPVGPDAAPVVLEIGAKGLTEGIEVPEIDLFTWEARVDLPDDRPEPITNAPIEKK